MSDDNRQRVFLIFRRTKSVALHVYNVVDSRAYADDLVRDYKRTTMDNSEEWFIHDWIVQTRDGGYHVC